MTVPPRLFVVPAAESPLAVVLRRGPSAEVATVLWDRGTGEITLGQWLRGRIYEHRCDLSPDGRHFVYFAGKSGKWWTAVSRAPYLHAIYLLPQNSTWHGGGAFRAPGKLWLNGSSGPEPTTKEFALDPDPLAFPHSTDGFHMGDLYASRMTRRGWHQDGTGYDVVLRKLLPDGGALIWRVSLGDRNRALVAGRYTLVLPDDAERDLSGWEWADLWDGQLFVAAKGALWRAEPDEKQGYSLTDCIHDFTDMQFEERKAPYDDGR